MKAYLIRRTLLIIPTFFGISLITFLIIQLAPGNPVYMKLQAMQGAMGADRIPAEVIEQTKILYGLDKPLPMRYAIWLSRLVRFDFGDSYKDHRPVWEKISEALPVTLQLNIASILLLYLISIPLGIHSATHQYKRSDHAITSLLFLLYSLPSFWVAMLLMFFVGGGGGSSALHALSERFFTSAGVVDSGWAQRMLAGPLQFNWFPVYGIQTFGVAHETFWSWFKDRTWHLMLPIFCLTYGSLAVISRYARAGLIEVVRQDYIRTARAYGFSERVVIFKYALRNSLIPIITQLGLLLPALIGGSVIIESIFSIPGMGRMTFEAILSKDYPLIMGIFSISALLTLAGLILSDILYAIVDPRIKYE